MNHPAEPFLAARDLLLTHRTGLAAARAAFTWPVLDRFNWALDHFDVMAAGNPAAALRLIGPDAQDTAVSFAALSARSDQVANGLRGLGVRRGDRVLLLLGNVLPLWEVMLAAMKLGAVVIPATTMLTPEDLQDRFTRGQVQHVVADGTLAPRFDAIAGPYTRIAVGGAPGWTDYAGFDDAAPTAFAPDGVDLRGSDTAAAVLHVRHDGEAQARRCTPTQSIPGRAPVDDVLDRACSPATCTSTSLRPGGPSTRGATSSRRGSPSRACIVILNYAPVRRRSPLLKCAGPVPV